MAYEAISTDPPTKPPPDKNKPYIWINGEWYLVITDTGDGVPKSLDDMPGSIKSQGK